MSPPDLLFAYGTLLRPEVWSEVAKQPAQFLPAWCEGYVAYQVAGADYPGLVPGETGDRTFGCIVPGIDQDVLQRLDDFEGSQYRRQVIRVKCAADRESDCWVYLWKQEWANRLSSTRWSPSGLGLRSMELPEASPDH